MESKQARGQGVGRRAVGEKTSPRSSGTALTVADALLKHVDHLQEALRNVGWNWETTVSIRNLETLGVLGGLTAEQRDRLVQLIGQCWNVEQVVDWTAEHTRKRKRWEASRDRRARKVVRKATAAVSAIEDFRRYVKKIEIKWPPALDEPLVTAIQFLDPQAIEASIDQLKVAPPLQPTRTRTDVMRDLYDFFVLECRLGDKGDATFRVGSIGNFYWDWDLPIIDEPKPKSDERKGCEAVRKAVERR